MATAVIMPRQGQSVESCIITEWHKRVGDTVKVTDILFSYETDKSSFEEEAKVDGEMLAVFFDEGDDVECLTNVCVIGQKGEDISEFIPEGSAGAAKGEAAAAPVLDSLAADVTSKVVDAVAAFANESTTVLAVQPYKATFDGRRKISPRARAMAEKNGALLEYAVASGPGGRIIARDVQALIDNGHTEAAKGVGGALPPVFRDAGVPKNEWEIVPLTPVRKAISKVMLASLRNTAQLTFDTSFDATDILEFRKKAKLAMGDSGTPVASVTDIIVYAVSRTLAKHNSLNAHFLDDDTMKIFGDAHIGLAVDTPRGLLVPTIFGTSQMGLADIAAESKRLQALCAQGTISPDFLQGASFTVSNLGAMGVEAFTPIINPPQTGILGVCSIIERQKGGTTYPAMGLSLTYDHRALDGADAARFLQDLVKYLESFSVFAVLG